MTSYRRAEVSDPVGGTYTATAKRGHPYQVASRSTRIIDNLQDPRQVPKYLGNKMLLLGSADYSNCYTTVLIVVFAVRLSCPLAGTTSILEFEKTPADGFADVTGLDCDFWQVSQSPTSSTF